MAASAHTLVQRLDPDLAGAHAPAQPVAARFGPAGLSHLPAHRRRQCAGGAGASAVYRRTVLFGAGRRPMWRGDSATVAILAAVYGMTVVIGYLTSAFLGWLGLARRGLLSTAWILLLTPVHWLLLSLAAWRALYQLAAAPYAWEKTE